MRNYDYKNNNFVEIHQPCPCGISSDAYCINADMSGFCFSCGEFFKGTDGEKTIPDIDKNAKIETRFFAHRSINESTFRFYRVKTKFADNEPIEVGFPYFGNSGSYKLRSFDKKAFYSHGDMKRPGLFGRELFDAGSLDSVTITEGEYDAMSIYEVTRGKTAAVSLKSSSGALKDCVAEKDWLNSFKKIIICCDNDEVGQKAAKQISALFDFNKVYHVKMSQFKDANDYLQNDKGAELFKVWSNARRYSPDNIISSFKEIEKSLDEVKEDQIGTYPFGELNRNLFGLHKGEIICIKAGSISPGKSSSGTGKTEFLRALEYHLLKTTNINLGIIHLEEDSATTIKAIAGYELEVPAVLPDCGLSKQDILDGYKKAVREDDRRVHIYSSFELEDEQIFLDNLRFLAVAAECQVIFLDHITWLATGLEQEDERRKLDRLSQKLKLLAKELKICIVFISHTNDDGRTRGSRNVENVSNTIIHLTRNKDSPDLTKKNTVNFLIEKVRLGGRTGPSGHGFFDPMSNKLREFKIEDDGVEDRIKNLHGR